MMLTAKGYWLSTAAAVFWTAFGILCLVFPLKVLSFLGRSRRRSGEFNPEGSQILALRLVGLIISVGFLILLVGSLR